MTIKRMLYTEPLLRSPFISHLLNLRCLPNPPDFVGENDIRKADSDWENKLQLDWFISDRRFISNRSDVERGLSVWRIVSHAHNCDSSQMVTWNLRRAQARRLSESIHKHIELCSTIYADRIDKMVSQWNEEVSDVLNSVVSWVPRATMDWWKKWYMMADSAGFAFYIVDVFINVIIRGLAMLKVDQSADKEVVEKYEVQMILKHWYDAVALCDITEDVAKRHWSMKKKGKDLERDKDCIDKWLLIR